MQNLLKVVRWTSLLSLPVFLFATPNSSAWAGSIGTCTTNLISSGVDRSSATSACSDAIEPQDLAACVAKINVETDIEGTDALQSCYRVRRPFDLADCVVDISSELAPDQSAMILDSCQRSLLPIRHAECTLDLASVAEISGEDALKSCLAAEITPGDVAPEGNE
ncbi:MAG: hypothetical protein AAGE84_30645 [Cyanobacteria bacterium P01_G01_bin.39]